MTTTTTYAIFANDEQIATSSKKGVAIEKARSERDASKVDVRVETSKGTIVFALDAPRKIKMSAPYTRVVAMPEKVVEMIDGKRVAYKRGRVGAQFALLDASKGDYTIWDVDRGEEVDVEVATTREAGRWFADERDAYRAATPV